MNNAKTLYKTVKSTLPIINALKDRGAICYLVGGCVRDLVLGREIKDIDIEIHGQSIEIVQETLEQFGIVNLVGKQFGVLRLQEFDVDWSLPRRDSQGRKPMVSVDPHMSFKDAARRRDLTMNATGINLNECIDNNFESLAIVDFYNGLDAIKNKQLAAVDKTLFLEDPLRFFRVMQFIGRFEMTPDAELQELCKTMDLRDAYTQNAIARERIEEEIKKLLLKSRRPSLGFRWLVEIGRLYELFPELYALIGVKQNPEYHPEGDVFEHSMQAVDASSQLDYVDDQEKLRIVLGALCHDLGKPSTTDVDLHCYAHDDVGVPIAQSFLKRFTQDQLLIKIVSKLVKYHMRPHVFIAEGAKPNAYKRLAAQLAPEVTMRQLALVALADSHGRKPGGHEPFTGPCEKIELFLEKAEQAHVMHKPEVPVLQGRDLLDVMQPGPEMGRLLALAYEIQLEEGIQDPVVLKKRVRD